MPENNEYYVVCYDIPNDKLRDKIAERLLDFGVRVQYSVFECCLSNEHYNILFDYLQAIMRGEDGTVIVYRLGGQITARRVAIGEAPESAPPDVYII